VADEKGATLKFNLSYKFTDTVLVYATYSRGFRPGGVNRVGDLPPYRADYLGNYEMGWKTQWLDNCLRFIGAVFRENWKDFQFSLLRSQ
jgi:iron complex outermembrane recepter protein